MYTFRALSLCVLSERSRCVVYQRRIIRISGVFMAYQLFLFNESGERMEKLDQSALNLAEKRERDLWLLVSLGQNRHASLLDDLVTRELSRLRSKVRVEDTAT